MQTIAKIALYKTNKRVYYCAGQVISHKYVMIPFIQFNSNTRHIILLLDPTMDIAKGNLSCHVCVLMLSRFKKPLYKLKFRGGRIGAKQNQKLCNIFLHRQQKHRRL